jgi:hypothetical protein
MAESAFMMEPLSDSMEEDIFPVSRRSVGLRERGEGGEQERERGMYRTYSKSWLGEEPGK